MSDLQKRAIKDLEEIDLFFSDSNYNINNENLITLEELYFHIFMEMPDLEKIKVMEEILENSNNHIIQIENIEGVKYVSSKKARINDNLNLANYFIEKIKDSFSTIITLILIWPFIKLYFLMVSNNNISVETDFVLNSFFMNYPKFLIYSLLFVFFIMSIIHFRFYKYFFKPIDFFNAFLLTFALLPFLKSIFFEKDFFIVNDFIALDPVLIIFCFIGLFLRLYIYKTLKNAFCNIYFLGYLYHKLLKNKEKQKQIYLSLDQKIRTLNKKYFSAWGMNISDTQTYAYRINEESQKYNLFSRYATLILFLFFIVFILSTEYTRTSYYSLFYAPNNGYCKNLPNNTPILKKDGRVILDSIYMKNIDIFNLNQIFYQNEKDKTVSISFDSLFQSSNQIYNNPRFYYYKCEY